MKPRWEKVADYLCGEVEKSKPSLSPETYTTLDPYLTGFEKGLGRAQHIIRTSTRHALTKAAG